MATWRLRETKGGHFLLEHMRPGCMGVFHCGVVHASTEPSLVIAWAFEHGAEPGDLLLLPGRALQFLPPVPGKS